MPEPLPARIRAYSPRDEKEVRFMVGQAQMESLAYANNRSKVLFFYECCVIIHSDADPLASILPSRDSRHMDRRFFHVRSVHGLVAEFRVWNLELVTSVARLFRPRRTHHVLRRLVMHQPAFILLSFDTFQ